MRLPSLRNLLVDLDTAMDWPDDDPFLDDYDPTNRPRDWTIESRPGLGLDPNAPSW